jgi:hypothetical protein
VRAGWRCVFDDRNLRVRGPERHVRQRLRLGNIGRVLRHGIFDQAQWRDAGERGKAGQ